MEQSTKPCARCGIAPRNGTLKSYCADCQKALARESSRRRQERGRQPLTHCSRCGLERDGSHSCYCAACFRLHRDELRAGPCARCGAQRDPADKTNPSYCYSCWRGWWLWRKYGITAEQYDAMLISQDHRCKICRTEANGRMWHVDHDHESGRVRGVLCDNCNRGLGHFNDDPGRLRRAADYLEALASH